MHDTRFTGTKVPDDLIEEFIRSRFRVLTRPALLFYVDQFSAELDELHHRFHVPESVYLSACNPYSRILEPVENASRQQRLADDIRERDLSFLQGIATPPDDRGPDEPGFLVLGMTLATGKAMGVRHEQNAIVHCSSGAAPRLVLLR